jgi:hypothetical protein
MASGLQVRKSQCTDIALGGLQVKKQHTVLGTEMQKEFNINGKQPDRLQQKSY